MANCLAPGIDVRYADGHCLAGVDTCYSFRSCGQSQDGLFSHRNGLHPELLEKVLIGWPCPTAGVRQQMVAEHRRDVPNASRISI